MFDSLIETEDVGQVERYAPSWNGRRLTYSDVLVLLDSNASFREYVTTTLRRSSFGAFRWETPSVSLDKHDRPFEFVLVNQPTFVSRHTDQTTFHEHFSADDDHDGVVTFPNLRGDSLLVVPTPQTTEDAYGHFAAFLRLAPDAQIHSLWRAISQTVTLRLGREPLWLNTAGDGVAWLHVRIDSNPKYYTYGRYKSA